jgi:hypothetical protein
MRVHSALDRTPFRVPRHLPAVRPVGRNPTLLRSRHPSTTSPGRAPVGAGFRPPPPRFRPQVLATSRRFPGRSELAALFRAAAVPGLPLPSEPRLAEIAHPSPGRLLPCGHPRATCVRSRGLSPRVSPTPTSSLRRLPVSPRGYGFPFGVPTMAGSPPGHPGPRAAGSRPTTRIIRFEASFPLQSSRCRPRRFPCRSSRALLGVPPLQSLLHPPLGPSSCPTAP